MAEKPANDLKSPDLKSFIERINKKNKKHNGLRTGPGFTKHKR